MDANANLEKALVINRQLQLQLYAVREKIEKLLKNVKEIYQENEELVRTGISKGKKKGFGMRGAYMKGGTFYLKGSMFFKDYDCRNCPDNPDYHARKQQGEMFPRDLDLKSRHVWSYKDKKGLVEAIKEQIIDHLKQTGRKVDYNTKDINSEQLVKLLEKVSSDFRIDWEDISMHNLQHRHSMNSCEAMWNVFLHPSLKRSAWTQEENLKLADVAKKYNFQNWQAIANEIGRRSEFQCFVQYQNYIFYMENENSFKWNKEEDERLIEVIEKNSINGQINWSNVMVHFPHRARTTLQSRYTYSLNPRISRARFTPEEDLLLLAAVKEYGGKFSYIPRSLFPNRTSLQLRSRYLNTLVHRHKQQPWTLESDTKLMDFVAKHGTHSWKKCEEFIQTHSRTSCRTRFMVIKRFFEKNPNASLADLQRKKKKRWTYVNTENWTEKLEELRENPDALVAKRIIEKRKPSKPKIKKEPKPRVKKEPKEKVKRKPARKPAVKKPPPVPKPKKRPRKIYIQRLRKNYRILYHSVKYAYDYKLGVHPILNNTPKYDRLSFVRHALQLKNREDGKKFRYDVNIPQELRRRVLVNSKSNKDIVIPNGFSLPTSWSTAMAFRALCIHTARPDLESVTAPSFDASNEHINLFRERFRTLFYTTGLLSRINPQMVLAPDPPPENVTEESSTLNPNESIDSQANGAEDGDDLNRNEGGKDEPPLKRIKITKKLTLVDQILCIKGKEPLGT